MDSSCITINEVHPLLLNNVADENERPLDVATSYSDSHSPGAPPFLGQRQRTGSATFSDSNVEIATERWVNLLFRDAIMQNEDLWNMNFETQGFNIFGNSVAVSPAHAPQLGELSGRDPEGIDSPGSSNLDLLERNTALEQDQLFEVQLWQSEVPIQILEQEPYAFRHFVQHISNWVCDDGSPGPLRVLQGF